MNTRTVIGVGFALTAGMLLATCAVGPSAARHELSTRPQAIRTHVMLQDTTFHDAELLAVTDSALLVLTADQHVVRVHYSAMRSFTPHLGLAIYGGATPSEGYRAHLRRLSRFPQGLPQAQLDALLAHHRQAEVEVRR